ncbi:MAG: alpha/beta hydrolase [Actinomycetia bacterium]|nr:alpha/beta hydrolase [Actinomycetes bacterium]
MTTSNSSPTKPRRVRRLLLGAITIIILIVGATGATLVSRDHSAISLLRAGQEIDIGGREMFIHCMGAGSPTVLLEHGLGSNGHEWHTVQNVVAGDTRVCWTSRAGMGLSDRAPETTPRTANDAVDDLTALLDAVEMSGPYVLVGHSFGGYVVRLFTARRPDDVVGVILVDSTHEDQPDVLRNRLSPAAWEELAGFLGADNPENIDLTASAREVQLLSNLGSTPLVVLEATEQSTDADAGGISSASATEIDAAMAQLWPELQADLASLSTRRIHRTIPDSGHFIQNDDPQAVIDAITWILDEVAEP